MLYNISENSFSPPIFFNSYFSSTQIFIEPFSYCCFWLEIRSHSVFNASKPLAREVASTRRIDLAKSRASNPSKDSSVRTSIPSARSSNIHTWTARIPSILPVHTIRLLGSTS